VAENPPTAVITATPDTGTVKLKVALDGSGSSQPDPGDSITYSWDLDGDGVFGDGTRATARLVLTTPGDYVVSLRVTDKAGLTSTASTTIHALPRQLRR